MAMSRTANDRGRLIDRYASAPQRLRAALAKVPAEAMRWRPKADAWSVHEVVCHCADAEMNAAARIRYLVAEAEPLIVGYDESRWAKELDYHALPLESALALVDATHAFTTPLLRNLTEPAWSKEGRHTESGPYTAERWLEIYAEHLDQHVRQIERNLEAWNGRDRPSRAGPG